MLQFTSTKYKFTNNDQLQIANEKLSASQRMPSLKTVNGELKIATDRKEVA